MGQTFTLQDWAHASVADDAAAPQNGFLFRNTPSAAAVLYETVKGKRTLVSITPEAILLPSQYRKSDY